MKDISLQTFLSVWILVIYRQLILLTQLFYDCKFFAEFPIAHYGK